MGSRAARIAVYNAVAELMEAQRVDEPPLDRATVEKLVKVANHRDVKRPGERWYYAETVRRWVEDPDKWSPFIDEVAVARALDFDWGVIDRLTRDEREVFLARLENHPDPFGHGTSRPEEIRYHPGAATPRFRAWKRGTDRQRDTLQAALRNRAKRRAKATEAA